MAFDLETIRAAARRVAASHGLEVVDVEFGGGGKHRTLTVSVEKDAAGRAERKQRYAAPEALEAAVEAGELPARFGSGTVNLDQLSWVTHEDCEAFSSDFGPVLDVEDLVPGAAEYTLEVSSPGLDRRLEGEGDLARFAGSMVKVQTADPVQGNRHWQGRLAEVVDGRIRLDLTASKGAGKQKKVGLPEIELEISGIEKASLLPEF
jgi:ribosome maturation factor RimP